MYIVSRFVINFVNIKHCCMISFPSTQLSSVQLQSVTFPALIPMHHFFFFSMSPVELVIKIFSLIILLYSYYMFTYDIQMWTHANIYFEGRWYKGISTGTGLRILCDDPMIDIFHLWVPFIFKIYTQTCLGHIGSSNEEYWGVRLCINAHLYCMYNSAEYYVNTRIRLVDL